MPMLDRLTVRGFKSIRALEDFELRALNVLIGPNGAGKSNFISLFRMLGSLFDKRLQQFVTSQDGPDALLFGGRKRTQTIETELTFKQVSYRVALTPASGTLAVADEEARFPGRVLAQRDGSGLSPSVYRRDGRIEGRVESKDNYDREARLPGARLRRDPSWSYVCSAVGSWRHVYHFHDTSETAPIRQAQPARDNLVLKPDAGNLAPFLRRLRERHPDHYRQIMDSTRSAAPFLGDTVYRREAAERIDLEWFHASDPDTPMGQRQLSDGTLRFLSLATLLLQPTELQPQLLLIDEPELGLHPLALTLLAEMLQSASEARQVIVSTQSADLVNEIRTEDVVLVNRRDGESVLERLDSDLLQDWLQEYSVGQLWKAEVVGGGPAP